MVPPSTKEASPLDQVILECWVRTYSEHADGRRHSPDVAHGLESTRAGSDSRAAWKKWHKGLCASWFSDEQIPWYKALEQARVECLAGKELPGIARNLKAIQIGQLELAPPVRRLYRKARTAFGLDFDCWNVSESEKAATASSASRGLLNRVRKLIGRDAETELDSVETRAALEAAGKCLDDEVAFARAVYPLVVGFGVPVSGRELDSNSFEQEQPQREESEEDAEVGYGTEQQPERHSRIGNYAIFHTTWDECEKARVWHQQSDAEALRELNALDRRKVQKLAHDLQRRLLVKRLRHWDFELEEGVLDNRKLAALVGECPDYRVFKCEREAQVPEACVTLLVDQSGSMRGSAHLLAAQAIDVAVHTLEVCGVTVEVLGYTTAYGADNPVVESWRKAGKPNQPGRLNALRHIIFKAAGQPWRVARRHLGLLLRSDFGHENIDGESLQWAARRLLARRERRKILIVISDGSPYDEATVENNGAGMLVEHLRDVIEVVERTSVHLVGIGTGREVGRYYRNAVTVRRSEMIGEILFGALGESLDQPAVP